MTSVTADWHQMARDVLDPIYEGSDEAERRIHQAEEDGVRVFTADDLNSGNIRNFFAGCEWGARGIFAYTDSHQFDRAAEAAALGLMYNPNFPE